MGNIIDGYQLWRLEVPLGRVIGDSNCSYDSINVVALCLKTSDGHTGWGYDATLHKGNFSRPAWYIKPMAALTEMEANFEGHWWRHLNGRAVTEAHEQRASSDESFPYLTSAVDTALWDLIAQQAGQPLYRFLGGTNNKVTAYGSILDFPLSESEAIALAQRFVADGFRAIKVKVGAEDPQRDIRRLQAIREAVGNDIELTADANTMWTWQQTEERLEAYIANGIEIGYIEDPLCYNDLEGYRQLAGALPLDVVGHDYSPAPADDRALLETGAIKRLRNSSDIASSLEREKLAREFGVPTIVGNSLCGIGIHIACAAANLDRMEYSMLGWDRLIAEPVQFKNGQAIAPERAGHGLAADPAMLAKLSQPEA